MTSLVRVLPVLLFAVALLGCGRKISEVLQEQAPAFAELRKKLSDVSDDLPPLGSVTTVARVKLDPTPVYKEDGGNMAIMMAEHLEDPDKDLDFDLYLGSSILTSLRWTGPNNPMASPEGRSSEHFENTLKQALATRYVAVFRIVSFDKPVIAEDTFTGGDLTAELLIVDLTTMEITPIGPVEATPPESINFTYKEGESAEEAAKRFIQSNIWAQVREAVKNVLEEGAGAQVTLD